MKSTDKRWNNVKLLLDALRSGKYKQGKGALHFKDKFCCLGVACETYQKEVGGLYVDVTDSYYSYDNYEAFLPPNVANWFGFATVCGNCLSNESLVLLNDEGYTFEEIADFIESNPPGLFMPS